MKNFTCLLCIGFAVALTGCTPYEDGTISKTLLAEEFQNTLIREKGILIDVRSKEEYAEAHINDAVNIDVNAADFRRQIDSLNKETTYFLYCKSGKRSLKAMELMKESGFMKLYNLKGGISEWRQKNFPVIKKEQLQDGHN